MSRYVSIGVAAKTLGVSIQTLRRWDEEGTLVADRTPKNHRRYDLSKITPELIHDLSIQNSRKTIAYARVSSHDQKADLERDRKSTRLNSSHVRISYAVFCLKKKNKKK